MCSILSKTNKNISVTFILSSASAFKILSFGKELNLYLICQFQASPIQQQIKIWCQKYGQMGIQLSDRVENIVEKGEIACYEQFLLFPQCFQKLSDVKASKWVSMK